VNFSSQSSSLVSRLFVCASLCAAVARADTLAFSSGLTYPGVHVDRIEDGKVYFVINGEMRSKPASEIVSISLDDEPDFNAGDSAYQSQNYATAADSYSHTISTTDKDWLKNWIAPRLLDAANRASRFDLAALGWIHIAETDPAAAANQRPAVPTQPSDALNNSVPELNDAVKSTHDESKRLILGLLLDVQTARKDSAAAAAAAQQLTNLAGGNTGDSDASLAEQKTRLALARLALYNKKFDQAMATIDSSAQVLTDPRNQADALYLRAQAEEGIALATDKPDDWKDAALAYLRVYVHFRDGPASVHSATALLKAAQIESAHLGDSQAAQTLYQKVVSEYKDSIAARQASSEMK
jgi:hypothetical protein